MVFPMSPTHFVNLTGMLSLPNFYQVHLLCLKTIMAIYWKKLK